MPTRGPQAGPVRFYFRGLQPMIANLLSLEKKLDNLDMSAPVRGAGKVYQKQFDTQGGVYGGGWRALSEYTQNIRRYRGFNPDSPILHQSGNLRKAAADYPAKFKGKSMNRTVPGGGYAGGDQTTLNISTTRDRATLMLSGEKVANNFGGSVEGHGWQSTAMHNLPRRTFWFINDEVRQEATKALMETIQPELDKLS